MLAVKRVRQLHTLALRLLPIIILHYIQLRLLPFIILQPFFFF